MWNEIKDEKDIQLFMTNVCCFHDGCVKEMKYLSGAYVGDNLGMWPINDKRVLSVIVQRQFAELTMVEMQFYGLRYLKLFPELPGQYTCEIIGSKMFFKDGCIYWCNCEDIAEDELEDFEGIVICAEGMRWRAIEGHLGEADFFVAATH